MNTLLLLAQVGEDGGYALAAFTGTLLRRMGWLLVVSALLIGGAVWLIRRRGA